jgi:Protein of unknown function (DUF3348)
MTRVLPRPPIYRSNLTRQLAELALLEHVDSTEGFAEKLGWWVDFRQAITLHGIHSTPSAAQRLRNKADPGEKMQAELTRRRTLLTAAIQRPLPVPDLSLPPAKAYEPLRRHHLLLQRDMGLQTQQLRSHVRGLLSGVSPSLQKLIELDAAFEHMLSERESQLFSTATALLEKHFKQLLKLHVQDPPTSWLPAFGHDLQTALLNELEVRLHPAAGLIEAYNEEKTSRHA